jgi:hypothetical protein
MAEKQKRPHVLPHVRDSLGDLRIGSTLEGAGRESQGRYGQCLALEAPNMKKPNEAAALKRLDEIERLFDRTAGTQQAILSIEPDPMPEDSDNMLIIRRRFVEPKNS